MSTASGHGATSDHGLATLAQLSRPSGPARNHGAMRPVIQPRGTRLDPCRPATAPPPAAPPGQNTRSQLLQVPGLLMVTGITHRRRRLPAAHGCSVTLPQLGVGLAEVAQGHALAVPVADLPADRQRLLVAAD